jgi:oligopeptide/dipeptide ABC transporter ATP-binding protein
MDEMPGTSGHNQPADETLMRTVNLSRHFKLGGIFSKQILHAVDDASITIRERQIVALVGESGSGKSTVARLLAMVYRPTHGEIYYRGRSVHGFRSRKDVLWYRGQVPMVFQDPYSSINPVFRVSHGVIRNLVLHRPELSRAQRNEEAERVFGVVGLTPSGEMLRKFPYEMSGGQRQRVGFAQALAVRPKLILADEPVSMLDVSIRAGILNLMVDLRDREAVSILYITHDIASARYVADRIVVMYAGHVVETGPAEEVLARPKHPYTQLLLSAVPDPREPISVSTSATVGEPPRVVNPTEGCRFRWRCPLAVDECSRVTPRLRPMGTAHSAACHVAVADAPEADGVPA